MKLFKRKNKTLEEELLTNRLINNAGHVGQVEFSKNFYKPQQYTPEQQRKLNTAMQAPIRRYK